MVSEKQAFEVPDTKVDVLHILALNYDNLTKLSPEQIAAIRRIYFLDCNKTVEQRVREGDLVLTPADVSEYNDRVLAGEL